TLHLARVERCLRRVERLCCLTAGKQDDGSRQVVGRPLLDVAGHLPGVEACRGGLHASTIDLDKGPRPARVRRERRAVVRPGELAGGDRLVPIAEEELVRGDVLQEGDLPAAISESPREREPFAVSRERLAGGSPYGKRVRQVEVRPQHPQQ